jgi:proteic killer suppression protein
LLSVPLRGTLFGIGEELLRPSVRIPVIRNFADKRTAAIFSGIQVKTFDQRIQRKARQKLQTINAANALQDLSALPGNLLELLRGDRAGQYSIRVNDQWRICFSWHNGHASDVEIVDYH